MRRFPRRQCRGDSQRVRPALRRFGDAIDPGRRTAPFLQLDRAFHLGSYRACVVEPLSSSVVRLWNSSQPCRCSFTELSGLERMSVVNAEHRCSMRERYDVDDAAHTSTSTRAR
ncbi:FCD domain-containing protein [Mycolicibacterium sp.]|uniref:FCD domain-containing protein n=1 Tax=Mycolicibacterium sp. TaxID=2320850 RepID=UPI0037C53C59